jgi:hypothetical protein
MKRLDQSHNQSYTRGPYRLPRLTCPGRESNPGPSGWEMNTLQEPFEQLVNSYSEHPHISAQPMENARDSKNVYKFLLVH